ncbi:MAG: hypothetical protein Q9183_007503 [Haloplaca sp. 2 TL-2023]
MNYDRQQLATPESSQKSASRSDTNRSDSNVEQSPVPTVSSQADQHQADTSATNLRAQSEPLQDGHRSPSPVLDDRSFITSTSTSKDLLDRIPSTEDITDEEFGSDAEIRDCLLTDAERNIKERIWTHENSQYLRNQQSKLLKQQLAEANGTARVVVKRKRRSIRMGDVERRDGVDLPTDAGDAVGRMMQTKAYSRKINYGNIKEAFRSERGETPRESSLAPSDASAGTPASGPTVTLSPSGEITVETPPDGRGTMVEEVGATKGDSREEAIEVEDGGESDPEDYYDEEFGEEDYDDDEAMEMAGVGDVLEGVQRE